MGKTKRKRLSPVAQEIARLVKERGGQRAFARESGFSQAVISKIVNGLQEPGSSFIEAVSALPDVDSKSVLSKAAISSLGDGECFVPVAYSLLLGSPSMHPDELTSDHVQVAATDYKRSLYGVRGKSCRPACSDPDEAFQPEDILIIDSAVEHFKKNIQRLDGKLVAIAKTTSKTKIVTLRRIFCDFNSSTSEWELKTFSDSKIEEIIRDKRTKRSRREKDQRVISLDAPTEKIADKYIDKKINLDEVAGVAIQLIRQL